MRLASLCLAALLVACEKGAATVSRQVGVDERVELFFEPSMARGAYNVDLADITPILIETLRTGDHDAIRRAKMELAGSGVRGVEATRRLIERYRSDPAGVDYLRNAVDVLSLSEEPSATPLLWPLLEQPSESLRIQVLRGMLVHPRKESFDPALAALADSPDGYQAEICSGLARLDLERAQRLWLSWVENGDNPSLWQTILPYLGALRDPELVVRARVLLERKDLDRAARIWLCASACQAGDLARDERALAELRVARESKNPTERDLAVRALACAGRFEELSWTLAHDELAGIRALVVRAAAERIDRPEARELLRQACNDVDELVAKPALTALATAGRTEAVDGALQWLASPALVEVESGIQILLERMRGDPALAQRVFEILAPRLESTVKGPSVERAMLIKILGQIPHPAATSLLLDLALATRGELESTRAQRFILRQSVNAGPAAQDALARLWRTHDDPLLRMDALEALSALGGEHGRELLIEVLEDPRASGQEIVYVADRLVRIGPAVEVAWQLKRAALRIEDGRAREALQGILWRWYPAPEADK